MGKDRWEEAEGGNERRVFLAMESKTNKKKARKNQSREWKMSKNNNMGKDRWEEA